MAIRGWTAPELLELMDNHPPPADPDQSEAYMRLLFTRGRARYGKEFERPWLLGLMSTTSTAMTSGWSSMPTTRTSR